MLLLCVQPCPKTTPTILEEEQYSHSLQKTEEEEEQWINEPATCKMSNECIQCEWVSGAR